MSGNRRIFYAMYQAGVAPDGSTSFTAIHGLQSCGITTTFNLTQALEIGQAAIYENIEGVPDIEVSMEKLLDGYAPLFLLGTQNAPAATLIGRSAQQVSVGVSIFADTAQSANGSAPVQVNMSGLFVNSYSLAVTVGDNAKETVSFVGSNKTWLNGVGNTTFSGAFASNTDAPASITGSGGVNKRQDVLFAYPITSVDSNGAPSGYNNGTIIPQDVFGISSSGTNDSVNGIFNCHLQGVTISANFGREKLFELGHKGTYFRYMSIPVEVTTEITVISASGDQVQALQDVNNLSTRSIRLAMREGTRVDCGTRNKLSSVSESGGDTGGGNRELTYTYTTYNDLTVLHPVDPTTALRY